MTRAYFGLRKYKADDEIWGGLPACQHVWGNKIPPPNSKSGKHQGVLGDNTNSAQDSMRHTGNNGCRCSLCGAWQGQLGCEPSPELYIKHLIEIMREVKRV